jgi:membrane dipeptidase/D-alanyl-D-alanine dipeptidase
MCDHSRNLDDEQLNWIKNCGGVVQAVAFKSYLNEEKNKTYNEMRQSILKETSQSENFEILTKDQIEQLSKEGEESYHKKYKEIRELTEKNIVKKSNIIKPVGVKDLVDHIDYMVGKMGIDHVGISSDFDGGGGIDGWKDASETLNVTLELVARGYSEEDISKLWGRIY